MRSPELMGYLQAVPLWSAGLFEEAEERDHLKQKRQFSDRSFGFLIPSSHLLGFSELPLQVRVK